MDLLKEVLPDTDETKKIFDVIDSFIQRIS